MVYSKPATKKVFKLKQPKIIWFRKRRETPVGKVSKGDILYFKEPGGDVFARAKVSLVKETFKKGKYYVDLKLKQTELFSFPFKIYKKDRRAWIVCSPVANFDQQSLISLPSPTLEQLENAILKHLKKVPSKKEIEKAFRAVVNNKFEYPKHVGTLFMLAILLSKKSQVSLKDAQKEMLKHFPSSVYPFVVFSSKK